MVEKMRATTLQQKFGFRDADLTTPEHDQIMIWLSNNCQKICERQWPNWPRKAIEQASERGTTLPSWPGIILDDVQWEHAVMSGQYIVGFIDLRASVRVPLMYIDARGNLEVSSGIQCASFEVKVSIPSLGEIIRQMNMYRAYPNYMRDYFTVVSPDNRWASQLRSLKIGYVKPDLPDEDSDELPF